MPLYRVEDGSGLVGTLAGMQRQTVLHYPTMAARAAQVKTPPLGMLTFIEAGSTFEWWNGTAWALLVTGTAIPRVPKANRYSLDGASTAATTTQQAAASITAVAYDRLIAATFTCYGHATGDNNAAFGFYVRVTAPTLVDSVTEWVGRSPPITAGQTVVATVAYALAANSAATVQAAIARTAGAASTWVIDAPTDLDRNRLDVATV